MEREEAIRRIQSWNLDTDDIEVLSVVIPELKESEDDRIKKALITFFQRFPYENIDVAGTNVKEAIAWLEKQYKKDEEIIILKDKIESLESARIAMQECHRLELEKQGEHKPADKVEPKFKKR